MLTNSGEKIDKIYIWSEGNEFESNESVEWIEIKLRCSLEGMHFIIDVD